MMAIFCAICFIADTVSFTACPPSAVSFAVRVAMSPVTLAFSLFWAMEALISSMEALVSSTLAACSEAPWLRD